MRPEKTPKPRPKLPFNPGRCIACDQWTTCLDVEDEVCQACLHRSKRRESR